MGKATRFQPENITWKSTLAVIFLVLALATYWKAFDRFRFVSVNRKLIAIIFIFLAVVFTLVHLFTFPDDEA